MYLASTSANSALIGAVDWLRGVLLGAVGTTIAVLAVAAVGLLMLSGRVPIRRGLTVVVGCFVLFSAASIADALVSGLGPSAAREPLPPVSPPAYTPSTPKPVPYDPYAGAAVPSRRSRPGAERPIN